MGNIYLSEFKHVALQAYCRWNRDPASPSYGSFDRTYWGWKYKDFSDATLQYSVKLVVEYARMEEIISELPVLLEGFVTYSAAIQLGDGSFNQCYPNERTPGVVYDILSTLLYVRSSPFLTSLKAQHTLDDVIEKAVGFGLKADEKHGSIANHIAEYAYEMFNYAAYSGDDRANRKGENYLDRLMSLYNNQEGWFQEYDGADPGYQTRTLRYLVKCAMLLDQDTLWETARKAADFIRFVIMPDGSIHPMLGCRSTAIVYPSGFERLANKYDSYHDLAALVRSGWQNGLVPLPSWLDFDNAIRLADDALEAGKVLAENVRNTAEEGRAEDQKVRRGEPALPVSLDSQADVDLPEAGIAVRYRQNYILYLGYKLGGVVIVYKREAGKWKIAYEDSGFLVRSSANNEVWLNRMPNSGELIRTEANRLLLKAGFYRSLDDEVTPLRMVLLRILNLTILGNAWVGDIFRKLVVKRLISNRQVAPLKLQREITLSPEQVFVTDRIQSEAGKSKWLRRRRLYRCRRVTGIHMASSRYFQPHELEKQDISWLQPLSDEALYGEKIELVINLFGRNNHCD